MVMGKTCEEIFGWSKGTASAAKRKIRFLEAIKIFEELNDIQKEKIAVINFNKLNIQERALNRQLTQGDCTKAYSLTQDDYNFAFMAQQMGYGYTTVANFLEVKSATVKDWFGRRSRDKEREQFNRLNGNEKSLLISRVKTAELSGEPKSISSI